MSRNDTIKVCMCFLIRRNYNKLNSTWVWFRSRLLISVSHLTLFCSTLFIHGKKIVNKDPFFIFFFELNSNKFNFSKDIECNYYMKLWSLNYLIYTVRGIKIHILNIFKKTYILMIVPSYIYTHTFIYLSIYVYIYNGVRACVKKWPSKICIFGPWYR